jgi:hypothetical protein
VERTFVRKESFVASRAERIVWDVREQAEKKNLMSQAVRQKARCLHSKEFESRSYLNFTIFTGLGIIATPLLDFMSTNNLIVKGRFLFTVLVLVNIWLIVENFVKGRGISLEYYLRNGLSLSAPSRCFQLAGAFVSLIPWLQYLTLPLRGSTSQH